MARHVALLRGVNVGGNRKVPMAELKAAFESLGFGEVRTYIQSGNVVFASDSTVEPAALERELASRLQLQTDVIIRTAADLERIIAEDPFPNADRKLVSIGFMASAPPVGTAESLDLDRFAPDQAVVRGTETYFHLPNGMGRAKLPPYLLRKLAVPTTVRNWNTTTKLLQLATT